MVASCDDANLCTTDTCTTACVHTPVSCDDADPCTIDSCTPASGCVHTPGTCPTTPPVATVEADATVSSASPNANLGNAALLNVDAGPTVFTTYVRVRVQGLGVRTVTSAKLRLTVSTTSNAQSNSGGRIHRVADCGWTETGLTLNNRPAIDPGVLSSIGAVALGQQVDFDLGNTVGGDGVYCYAIDSLSTDGVDYRSRQATTGRPQLVLTTGCACVPPAPICGDNVVNQPSEQCDGTSSAACPGLCSPTCTCPAPVTPPVATVLADVSVASDTPTTNLGTRNQLNVDAGPAVKRAFIRVQVSNVGARTVTSALLNLRVATTTNAQSASGGQIHKITNCTWPETTTNFNNQPAIDGPVISTLGAVALNQAVSFNITTGIPGD